jgi:hypothetical protein
VVFAEINAAERSDEPTNPHSEESLCYSTQIHDVTGELEIRVTFHPEPVEER